MRFLLDENTHFRLLNWCRDHGHDSIRVPGGLKNGKVIALAVQEKRILLTHDKDFADRLSYPPASHSGIVLLKIHPPSFSIVSRALQSLLANPPEEGFEKRLVILEDHGYHVLS
jgi:predicted nuclease of predicted toxin-antitoxin system